jgi:hypothetical protein
MTTELELFCRDRGRPVATVYSSTPAQNIGLRRGDVITAIDGTAIASAVELRQMLLHHRPGNRVTVGWTDSGGHEHTVRSHCRRARRHSAWANRPLTAEPPTGSVDRVMAGGGLLIAATLLVFVEVLRDGRS